MPVATVSFVRYDLYKNKPVACIQAADLASNLNEIARILFSEWQLQESSLFLNFICDSESAFTNVSFESKRKKLESLKHGFKNLFDTDIRYVLLTSGMADDPVASAAGRASLDVVENANYPKHFNGTFIDDDVNFENLCCRNLNFKLIGINKIDGANSDNDFSIFDNKLSHIVLIENASAVSNFDLLKFRLEITKLWISFAEEHGTTVDDSNDERYVSLPANTFYEIPRSRQTFGTVYMINFYFGLSNDKFTWLLDSITAEIPCVIFKTASNYANFITLVCRCDKMQKISIEKRFDELLRSSSIDYNAIRQNVEKINDFCQSAGNINLLFSFDEDDSCFEKIPLLLARSLINCKREKLDDKALVRFLIRMNASCLLNDIKLDASFVENYYFYEFFEEVLINSKKERFVEWFLNSGIRIGKFLTFERLIRLFKNSESSDFFNNVVLGNLLGYVSFPNDATKFVKIDLKQLFYHLTSKMVKFSDISFDIDALKLTFSENQEESEKFFEKRCFDILIFWATLMKRNSLTRLLWSYSYDPLPLALVLSEIFKNLEFASYEYFVYVEDLKILNRYFKDVSVDLLNDADFRAPSRSYDILCYGFEQYSHVTATHLAYMSENRRFIAHIWCQRWLNRLLYGSIKICKLKPGCITAPAWLKVLLGALFVFPVKIWIKCPPKNHVEKHFAKRSDNDSLNRSIINNVVNNDNENNAQFRSLTEEVMVRVGIVNDQANVGANNEMSDFLQNGQRSVGVDMTCSNSNQPDPETTSPDFCCKPAKKEEASFCSTLYQFYNAPITKYWLHLTFRLIYLILFGLALSLPKCGNTNMDLIVWTWSFIDFLESLWIFHLKRKISRGSCRSSYALFGILIDACFLFLFITCKIVANQTYFLPSSFTGRVIAALYLLYKCYSTLFTYLPMHSTLGPLLIRVRLMICRDFTNFLILISLIVTSFAVVIHAVIYPDYPADGTLWAKAFKRAWFTLFLTPVDDLNEENRCKYLIHKNPNPYCSGGDYVDPTCPTVSPVSYIVVVQYLILIKLIFWPILFALFGKTAKEIDDEADVIWKYQFYCMVTDFSLKPPIPPPLTPIAFVFLCFFRFRFGVGCFRCNTEPAIDHPDVGLVKFGTVLPHRGVNKRPSDNYYNFWRSLARCLHEKRNNEKAHLSNEHAIVGLRSEIYELKQQMAKLNEELQIRR